MIARSLYRSLLILNLLVLGYCVIAFFTALEVLLKERDLLRAKLAVLQKTFGLIARIAGLRICEKGLEHLPDEPYLLLANHISYWDIIALTGRLRLSFLAKEEVKSWPFLGGLARMCGVIFVARDSVPSRTAALFTLAQRSREHAYCIFPEGTTTAAELPLWKNWHRGNIALAIRPGLRIFTVGIHYRDQPQQAWIGDDSFFPHLLKSLGRARTEIFLTASELNLDPKDLQDRRMVDLSHRSFLQVTELCQLSLGRASQRALRASGLGLAPFCLQGRTE